METIRSGISDLVNSLNKVRNNSTVAEEQAELQKIINVLFTLWEEVIRQNINTNTRKYKDALAALKKAEAASQAAIEDVHTTAAAIKAATRAARQIDKIVGVFTSVFG